MIRHLTSCASWFIRQNCLSRSNSYGFCSKQLENTKNKAIKSKNIKITADSMTQSVNVNKNKKSSKWIYATKHQEMLGRKEGKISIYCHLPHDLHNLSLRVLKNIKNSNLIVTSRPDTLHRTLKAHLNNQRYPQQETNESQQIIVSNSYLKLNDLIDKSKVHTQQYSAQIQISKHIQLEKQLKNTEKKQDQVYGETKQIKQYIKFKHLQQQLTEIANRQGYPHIIEMGDQADLHQYLQLQKKGVNIMFIFSETDILPTSKCLNLLENIQASYQILPSSDQLLNAVVGSGLPADRFSIDYYPRDIALLLSRRKSMKMTLAVRIQNLRLGYTLRKIAQIFGKQHIVYLKIHHGGQYKEFKGQTWDVEQRLEEFKQKGQQLASKKQDVLVIIAPFISDFNESLKEQINKKSHILGELQSPKINEVQMLVLIKKLQQMNKKQQNYDLNVYLLAAELLGRINNPKTVLNVLEKLIGTKVPVQKIENIVNQAQKQIVLDYLQIDSPLKDKTD